MTIDQTILEPADELAERKCAYQRDVAKANRIADAVFWLVLAERRHERLQ